MLDCGTSNENPVSWFKIKYYNKTCLNQTSVRNTWGFRFGFYRNYKELHVRFGLHKFSDWTRAGVDRLHCTVQITDALVIKEPT